MTDADPRLYLLAGATLFCIGFFGVANRRHLLRKIVALNVMSGGVFLIFIAVGMRNAAEIPDPVPHAMVLTGIVVSVSATGLALALLDRWQAISGRTELTREKDPDAS